MQLSPFTVIALASLGTLAAGQALLPTVKAQPVRSPNYHVRLDWQKAEQTPGGLVIHGRVTNIGRRPLTYTQVMPTLLDKKGKEIFRGSGYLTVSPLLPGQSAEFRDCEAAAPHFATLRIAFQESGIPVLVESAPVPSGRTAPRPILTTAKTLM